MHPLSDVKEVVESEIKCVPGHLLPVIALISVHSSMTIVLPPAESGISVRLDRLQVIRLMRT